jgi:hypothetical protein
MKTLNHNNRNPNNDRSWAQINQPDHVAPLNHRRLTDRIGQRSDVAPVPVQCTYGPKRLVKALRLFLSTKYSLKMSWNMAASN